MGIPIFALNAAAFVYAYPEGLAIGGFVFAPWLIILLGRRVRKMAQHVSPVIGILFTFLLVHPYVHLLWRFLWKQLRTGATAEVARGWLPGLLNGHWFPASFALGEQSLGSNISAWNHILPGFLLVFSIFGFRAWFHRHLGLFLCLLPLSLLCAWHGFLLRYDYGLYKVISMGWIIILPAIFVGLNALSSLLPRSRRTFCLSLGLPLLFAGAFTQESKNRSIVLWQTSKNQIEP
ncbi:MAG: hypothetical protein JO279_04450 [Verrucomicrobia bacterium]|nr:hypothetical protein [Verrucomicrobiota bacterium]